MGVSTWRQSDINNAQQISPNAAEEGLFQPARNGR